MLKDITLGQYFPGDSILHRTDARIKILMLIVYLVFVLCAKTAFAFGFVVIATGLLVMISEIPLKTVLKSLKPLLFVLLFTAVINLFFANGEDILWQWKFIKIYREGIENAVKMVIRLTSLVTGTSVLLTYTTSPLDLTDGIERLLVPLKKIGVPVHDFAMMMSIALRFIPTLIEETDKIISAQKARGADFESGN
ncbi:MAG: energy-coupling factor transporter transmembrane protein EcfT, partial [Clostridia bacterium]|nr:energy-coupling factor transporter transmembrane protein EcfT [Clostridia bacterium]